MNSVLTRFAIILITCFFSFVVACGATQAPNDNLNYDEVVDGGGQDAPPGLEQPPPPKDPATEDIIEDPPPPPKEEGPPPDDEDRPPRVTEGCGDEAAFASEVQENINVVPDKEANAAGKHLLLPPMEIRLEGVDTTTVSKSALKVFKEGVSYTDFTLSIAAVGDDSVLTFRNGATGQKAWAPSSTYSVKICHQIKTSTGVPVEPEEIVVQTRPSDELESIGISHADGNGSGVFYLPKNYDPTKAYPFAVLLHGLGGDGEWMVGEFKSLADSMGVILLGPDGFVRPNPLASGNTTYFNPNFVNNSPEDYDFVIDAIDVMALAFAIDEDKTLVAGMSMGAPATLFFAGESGIFTNAAMLHGVTWNYDPNNANDVSNVFTWEATPLGTYRPLFWYSTSKDDPVTGYDWISIPGMTVDYDLGYVEDGGYSVTHKFDYPGGHWMTAEEKADLFEWFLYGTAP